MRSANYFLLYLEEVWMSSLGSMVDGLVEGVRVCFWVKVEVQVSDIGCIGKL